MSTDDHPPGQHTLTDYQSGTDKPDWQPPGGHPRRCQHCHGHVTRQFKKEYQDNHGRLHACLNCLNARAILAGAGHNPEIARQYREELTDRQTSGTAGGYHREPTL